MTEKESPETRVVIALTADRLDLVVEALKADANRRTMAARRAAGEAEVDAAEGRVKDRRTPALKIMGVLAAAAEIERFALDLERAYANAENATPTQVSGPVEIDLSKLAPEAVEAARAEAEALAAQASTLDEDEPVDPITATADDEVPA